MKATALKATAVKSSTRIVGGKRVKKEITAETFIFPVLFIAFFALFTSRMGIANTLNTMMNTAYSLMMDTVLYLVAISVLMGAISALFSEFGLVTLINRLLSPLMKPIYGLPGAASLGVVTTYLSDNPAVLTLADDRYFRRFFKAYQLPALTNLGTAFGMGLIVTAFMLSQEAITGESYLLPVLMGTLGAIIGSIVSTRLMLHFTAKIYGKDRPADDSPICDEEINTRPVREGSITNRLIAALLDGGKSGVQLGVSIIPGVLVICTFVLMLTNGPAANGTYTGAAYEGIGILPLLASKLDFIITPLFGFSSPEDIAVPVTALGAAGAAISLVPHLLSQGLAQASDVAVFTAMCMCWSGYLSTHISMMGSLHATELTGKAILSHTIGGVVAGASACWLYRLATLIF